MDTQIHEYEPYFYTREVSKSFSIQASVSVGALVIKSKINFIEVKNSIFKLTDMTYEWHIV